MTTRYFLLAIFILNFNSHALAGAATNVFFTCENEKGGRGGREAQFEFHGKFHLQADFFQRSSQALGPAALFDAVNEELRFAHGFFVNNRRSRERIALRLSTPPEIKSLRVKKSPYPFTLDIDPILHPDVKIDHPYLLAGLSKRQTEKGDPGLEVEFTAQISGLYCGRHARDRDLNLEVDLPADPYLAYWFVAPRDRRRIAWNSSEFKINPCADPEYADIPDPHYYWYFWRPRNVGTDADGRKFSCDRWIRPDRERVVAQTRVTSGEVALPETLSFRTASLPTTRPLRVSAIFGVLDHKSEFMNLQALRGNTADAITFENLLDRLPERPVSEPGTANWISFLRHLPNIVARNSLRVSFTDDDSILLEGRFVRSQRPVQMRIFLGETDVLTTASPGYWRNLAHGLQHDDVVLYGGHSGLGENGKLARVLENTARARDSFFSEAPDYQIVAFFSCFSYTYFGVEVAAERARSARTQTDIIRTASPFSSARGHIIVLEQLDRLMAMTSSTGESVFGEPASSFFPNDLVLMTSFTSARAQASMISLPTGRTP